MDLDDVRILLVEDNVDHRVTMTLVLKGLGGCVYTAASAREALTLWRFIAPDVIVSDVFLPVDTGMTMLRELRQQGCSVPAIAVTAWGDDKTRAAAAEAGFAAHLEKPVTPRVLLSTITSLLAHGPTGKRESG